MLKDFEVQKKLGSGSFSQVYKVKRKSDGIEYAMKKVQMNGMSSKEKQNALNEVRLLASIQSPYIISYKEAFFDQTANSLFIIMEYAGGGDLQSKINYVRKKGVGYFLDENAIWRYLIQMLKGLDVLHRKNIYHRDIKSANVFIEKDHKHIKLGDLNVAKVADPTNPFASTQAGTPYYASPEVWSNRPYDGRCDIWSLGCVLYEMANLRLPFLALDIEQLQMKIIKGNFEPLSNRYSEDLQFIVNQCLSVHNRWTVQELLQCQEIQQRLHLDTCDQGFQDYNLLETIHMPKNIYELKSRLPKPKYHQNTDISLNAGGSPKMLNKQTPSNSSMKRSSSQDNTKEQKEQQIDLYQLPKRYIGARKQVQALAIKQVVLPPILKKNNSCHYIEQQQLGQFVIFTF